MKLRFLAFVIIAAGLVKWALAAEAPHDGVIQLDHEKVTAMFASAKGGLLLQTNNFRVQAGHRSGPGVVEQHEFYTDIFYIMDGTATFITGGSASEMKKTGTGEMQGREITGGEVHHLAKGDIIVIPTGVPHWFKETSDPFVYYIVKVSK